MEDNIFFTIVILFIIAFYCFLFWELKTGKIGRKLSSPIYRKDNPLSFWMYWFMGFGVVTFILFIVIKHGLLS